MRARLAAVGLSLAGVLGGLVSAGCTSSPPAEATGAHVYAVSQRAAAPQLRGPLLTDDRTFDVTERRGDVVVLNFWASWCPPCRAEADDLEATYQATKASGVSFIGINIRDERDAAKAFLTGRATYPSVFDPSGKVGLGLKVAATAIPQTFVLDRQGRIAAVIRGQVIRSTLEPIVAQIAAEPR
jgi:thiol-disulfide isomerase/thioredoxin